MYPEIRGLQFIHPLPPTMSLLCIVLPQLTFWLDTKAEMSHLKQINAFKIISIVGGWWMGGCVDGWMDGWVSDWVTEHESERVINEGDNNEDKNHNYHKNNNDISDISKFSLQPWFKVGYVT